MDQTYQSDKFGPVASYERRPRWSRIVSALEVSMITESELFHIA